MPLLISPIDGSPMKQVVRHGIEIDVCPSTGGVWLDKGELEKLLAMMQDAVEDSEEDFTRFKQAKAQRRLPPDYDSYAPPPQYRPVYKKYDDDDYEDYYKYKYGRKSKLRSLFDLFD